MLSFLDRDSERRRQRRTRRRGRRIVTTGAECRLTSSGAIGRADATVSVGRTAVSSSARASAATARTGVSPFDECPKIQRAVEERVLVCVRRSGRQGGEGSKADDGV